MNPPPRTTRRQYESILDASARVGVSTKTIRRWIASGHLAGYRMGPRLLRVDPDELDKMLTSCPQPSFPSAAGARNAGQLTHPAPHANERPASQPEAGRFLRLVVIMGAHPGRYSAAYRTQIAR